jgi:hypothetical protein
LLTPFLVHPGLQHRALSKLGEVLHALECEAEREQRPEQERRQKQRTAPRGTSPLLAC